MIPIELPVPIDHPIFQWGSSCEDWDRSGSCLTPARPLGRPPARPPARPPMPLPTRWEISRRGSPK